MANKAISELPEALNVNNQDLFVLEQGGLAKKLPAETFITEQGIINALAEALDGHGGISSVTLSSVSGRIRTYLITFTDGSATTFQVYDGTTIERIAKTSTAGLVDTYTVFTNDGTTTFFTVTNGADGTVSEAMLNDALKNKAPAVTETTESSAIANFTDGADDMVMHNVVAEINPVQSGSGDPSPDNIRPITGWTGCNVTRTGKNLIPNLKAQDTANRVRLGESTTGNGNPFKAGKYKISVGVTSGIAYSIFWRTYKNGVNGSVNNSANIVLTEDTNVKIWLFADNPGISVNNVEWFQVEVGSTATAYEPYQSNTLTVDWSTEAGTVYGGTIDVTTGTLTVTHELVDLGTLTWSYASSGQGRVQSNGLVSSIKPASAQSVVGNIVCDTYKTVSANAVYSGTVGIAVNDNGYLWVHDSNYTDGATFKTAMSGHYLAYEVATPQTYQLTPQEVKTLLGTNNVWADTGDTSVTYAADTKLYIEKLTMPTEDDMVANQAITSGKYFMIGNSLYLALANIASGAQITIGTNAQRVSLADALNTINS